jgi:hypothetical protein
MKFLLTIVLMASIVLPICAAEPNTLTSKEKSQGWKLLFDGKTDAGWRSYGKKTFPTNGWNVVDGCLKLAGNKGKPGSGGDIITEDKFSDFEFYFEWRIAPGSNSGVKYFVDEARAKSAIAHEYQIIDDEAHPDAKNGPIRMTASFYCVVAPTNRTLRPVGKFNQSKIIVQGNHVEHWLNGAKVVEYELGSESVKKGISESKFKEVVGFGTKFPTPFLLQDHGDEVSFRNLKVRELPVKK